MWKSGYLLPFSHHPHDFLCISPMLCKSQLLDAVYVWNQSMENRKSVDVLFLDISKAFDKVPHTYLMEKLKMVGIDGSLLSWMRDYLTNRRQIKVHR